MRIIVYFVRGLYETWERTSDVDMANYIEGYLNVQVSSSKCAPDLLNQHTPSLTLFATLRIVRAPTIILRSGTSLR